MAIREIRYKTILEMLDKCMWGGDRSVEILERGNARWITLQDFYQWLTSNNILARKEFSKPQQLYDFMRRAAKKTPVVEISTGQARLEKRKFRDIDAKTPYYKVTLVQERIIPTPDDIKPKSGTLPKDKEAVAVNDHIWAHTPDQSPTKTKYATPTAKAKAKPYTKTKPQADKAIPKQVSEQAMEKEALRLIKAAIQVLVKMEVREAFAEVVLSKE